MVLFFKMIPSLMNSSFLAYFFVTLVVLYIVAEILAVLFFWIRIFKESKLKSNQSKVSSLEEKDLIFSNRKPEDVEDGGTIGKEEKSPKKALKGM